MEGEEEEKEEEGEEGGNQLCVTVCVSSCMKLKSVCLISISTQPFLILHPTVHTSRLQSVQLLREGLKDLCSLPVQYCGMGTWPLHHHHTLLGCHDNRL